MGQIWSRVRKKPSTTEVLEEIEKEIDNLEEYRRSTVQQQKRFIASLLFYSVILYVVAAVFTFFFWNTADVKGQALRIIPLIIFPILIWLLKRFCHWYFKRKLETNAENLTDLLRKKRTILNDVKEKETYKKAKEILEKYDPEYKKKKKEEEEAAAAAAAQKAALGTPGSELRRRPVSAMGARGSFRGRGRGGSPPPSASLVPSHSPVMGTNFSMNGQQWPRPTGPPLPRPILPREQKMMDRFVDFLVGDGPSNRYALICQRCLSHNGMALREEFEYLAFRCCYCYSLNPARKVRPFAPRLAASPPQPAIALTPQNEDSQDSVTESDSEQKEDGHRKTDADTNKQTVEISEIKDEPEENEVEETSNTLEVPEEAAAQAIVDSDTSDIEQVSHTDCDEK